MGKFTVDSYGYVPAGPAYIKQRVKGHRKPYGAVAGGNGSFVMPGPPPKINLNLSSGGRVDIYPLVKRETCRSRVTKNYAEDICEALQGREYESIDELNAEVLKQL